MLNKINFLLIFQAMSLTKIVGLNLHTIYTLFIYFRNKQKIRRWNTLFSFILNFPIKYQKYTHS